MFDKDKIDSFFNITPESEPKTGEARHSSKVQRTKLFLPSVAAILLALLLLWPSLKKDAKDIKLDITRPKAGELEKLHVENTNFYITDATNKVHNFTAANIDETESNSKIIKLHQLEGIGAASGDAWIDLKTDEGFYNQTENNLRLPNLVEVFYSDGMNFELIDALYDFKASKIVSTSPISGDGELGKIESEEFEMNTKTGVLTFLGKTKLKISQDKFARGKK